MTTGRGMFHHHTATITPFSDNPDFDFEIRNVLGLALGGGADPGEVLAATVGINKNDHAGWFRAWQQLGRRGGGGRALPAAGANLDRSAHVRLARRPDRVTHPPGLRA